MRYSAAQEFDHRKLDGQTHQTDSAERPAVKGRHLRSLLAGYLNKWESSCMFRFLPTRLRRQYDLYFNSSKPVITDDGSSETGTAIQEQLELAPGVRLE